MHENLSESTLTVHELNSDFRKNLRGRWRVPFLKHRILYLDNSGQFEGLCYRPTVIGSEIRTQ